MNDETAEFLTLRDFFRYAVTRFNTACLTYGHGTDNAVDEAAFLVLEALHLPIDRLDPFLDARLTESERARLRELIAARIETRKPAAYLLGCAYMHGIRFHVDERVIVPRSFISEILFGEAVQGATPALIDPRDVHQILDLCTGSGCLAILAARAFPHAIIDATELSPDALEVARWNVRESGDAARITLIEGDLFAPVHGTRYDLILANPPYVSGAAMAALPPEYRHEPGLALSGGSDGLEIVRRILREAPAHLSDNGGLLCEIGTGRALLEAEFPRLPFTWLDTEASSGEVFWLGARDFAPPRPTPPLPRTRRRTPPRAIVKRTRARRR
jgi:ribosomal protein L3 glutamine methyltransferase